MCLLSRLHSQRDQWSDFSLVFARSIPAVDWMGNFIDDFLLLFQLTRHALHVLLVVVIGIVQELITEQNQKNKIKGSKSISCKCECVFIVILILYNLIWDFSCIDKQANRRKHWIFVKCPSIYNCLCYPWDIQTKCNKTLSAVHKYSWALDWDMNTYLPKKYPNIYYQYP